MEAFFFFFQEWRMLDFTSKPINSLSTSFQHLLFSFERWVRKEGTCIMCVRGKREDLSTLSVFFFNWHRKWCEESCISAAPLRSWDETAHWYLRFLSKEKRFTKTSNLPFILCFSVLHVSFSFHIFCLIFLLCCHIYHTDSFTAQRHTLSPPTPQFLKAPLQYLVETAKIKQIKADPLHETKFNI